MRLALVVQTAFFGLADAANPTPPVPMKHVSAGLGLMLF
jgi:hypothetical protein